MKKSMESLNKILDTSFVAGLARDPKDVALKVGEESGELQSAILYNETMENVVNETADIIISSVDCAFLYARNKGFITKENFISLLEDSISKKVDKWYKKYVEDLE